MSRDPKVITSGGKGKIGKVTERDPNICAAGLPSVQVNESVGNALQHYLLKDKVDALISDAIIPAPKPQPLPALRKPIQKDVRHAGPFGQVAELLNPPCISKFQSLVEDFKNTAYQSYWLKPLGSVRDPVPSLPEGFDITGTAFGIATPHDNVNLYDVVMPKIPHLDQTPHSKEAGVQVKRTYCSPPYKPDLTYGYRSYADKDGNSVKCSLTDKRVLNGTADRAIVNTLQSNLFDANQSKLGAVLAPIDNIKCVPEGHTFGILHRPDNLPECFTFCEINKEVNFIRKCLKHLNTMRKTLSKRFLPSFFQKFYLHLKYYDKDNTEWLSKTIIYDNCGTKHIRFDPVLIEPLLEIWQAFDGTKIKYKTFVHILNYREPCPEIPKIPDLSADCLDFRTTYTEMVKPDQPVDTRRMAGVPSGRYIDLDYPITPNKCVKAHTICLPQESDVKSCISPSVFTLLFVTHRDLYAKREPHIVRRVFEAAGEKFTDKRFDTIWEEAKQLHSQGWVCYVTFRQTLEKHPDVNEFEESPKKYIF